MTKDKKLNFGLITNSLLVLNLIAFTFFSCGEKDNIGYVKKLLANATINVDMKNTKPVYNIDPMTSSASSIPQSYNLTTTSYAGSIIIVEDTIAWEGNGSPSVQVYTETVLKADEFFCKQFTDQVVLVQRGPRSKMAPYNPSEVKKKYPVGDYRILSPDRTQTCIQNKSTGVMECYDTTAHCVCVILINGELVVVETAFKS